MSEKDAVDPADAIRMYNRIFQALDASIVAYLNKGGWFEFQWKDRISIDTGFLRQVYNRVDMARVAELVQANVEQRIADGIINHMATEIATDVKGIMSNRELREDLRAVIRQKIRDAAGAVSAS